MGEKSNPPGSKPRSIFVPHAPPHLLEFGGTFMVTAGTYYKQSIFNSAQLLQMLTGKLLELAETYEWTLQAWSVFPNHYHFVGSCDNPDSLKTFIRHLHSVTAREANKVASMPGRQVWHNFWDTRITYERSLYARLNYVMYNPVKHEIVKRAESYPFCSARRFREECENEFQTILERIKFDKINVIDDF
ncbi:MAG: transposase [bacterium]